MEFKFAANILDVLCNYINTLTNLPTLSCNHSSVGICVNIITGNQLSDPGFAASFRCVLHGTKYLFHLPQAVDLLIDFLGNTFLKTQLHSDLAHTNVVTVTSQWDHIIWVDGKTRWNGDCNSPHQSNHYSEYNILIPHICGPGPEVQVYFPSLGQATDLEQVRCTTCRLHWGGFDPEPENSCP